MARSRFLYNNLAALSTTTITALSNKPGFVTSQLKNGTGSATLKVTGSYTGANDVEYTVQVDDVSGGQEVGQATIRWKNSDSATWQGTGVATSGTLTFDSGLTGTFTSGTGDDFDLGDTWYFKGINRFSAKRMKDSDRDTRYRSADGALASATLTFVVDFGSAKTFDSVVLLDHNIGASGTITLEANASDSWGAPSFSTTLSYNASKILEYLSAAQTYRFVRLSVSDATNPDGYLQIGNLFLGEYLELTRTFKQSHRRDVVFNTTSAENRYGVRRRRLHSFQQTFKATYTVLSAGDLASLETMRTVVGSLEEEKLVPLYFNPDSDDVTEFWLMDWDTLPIAVTYHDGTTTHHTFDLDLLEVAKSVQD